jgi:hypothetical protein
MWRKFKRAQYHAKGRGIRFRMTFEEWCQIWNDSGHWHERGWRRGTYCMARFGDKGAYEVGNVKICLNEENRAERNTNYPLSREQCALTGRNPWAEKSPEEQARWSAAHRARISQRVRNSKGQFVHA